MSTPLTRKEYLDQPPSNMYIKIVQRIMITHEKSHLEQLERCIRRLVKCTGEAEANALTLEEIKQIVDIARTYA